MLDAFAFARYSIYMKQKPFSLFGEDLKLMSACPLCNAAKDEVKAQVVDENETAHLVHMQCAKCGSSIVALVVHAASGLNSVGMLTDLTYADVLKFRAATPIDADDTLAFYQIMQNQEDLLRAIA